MLKSENPGSVFANQDFYIPCRTGAEVTKDPLRGIEYTTVDPCDRVDLDMTFFGQVYGRGNDMDVKDKNTYTNIDEYIARFSPDIREKLQMLREVIKEAAPEAQEKISYQMPTFALYGNLVHFAAYQNHIGLYPAPSGIEAFKDELSRYKSAKGSVQFPLDEPLPYDLIARIVKYRVMENMAKAEAKRRK